MYEDPALFEAKTDEYFGQLLPDEAPSMVGLALYLGFVDRHSLNRYEERDGFSTTVKKARARIELDRHNRLVMKDTFHPGLIFDLKNNHGWKDKTETEHSGSFTVATGVPRADEQ